MSQALILAKKPHILIATPGRLLDHLENTKGFSLRALKFLVMDEADRILNMDFEVEVDKILKVIPRDRRTYLFSATMTKKVKKLQRACLQEPVKVEVSTKYQTVEKLQQYYVFIPVKFKVSKGIFILNALCHLKWLSDGTQTTNEPGPACTYRFLYKIFYFFLLVFFIQLY